MSADAARLRWRCRRGMRELDQLLGGWLEARYVQVDNAMKEAFSTLLDEQDPQLWDWLSGRGSPQNPEMRRIVDEIRTAIGFDYRPSRWLLAAVLIVATFALVSIALSGALGWVKTGFFAVVGGWLGIALGRFLRPQITRAAWQVAGHWRVTDADGREFTAELVRGVARGAWIVLNLRRSDGRRLVMTLGPDNCDVDARRRLRVRLASIAVE